MTREQNLRRVASLSEGGSIEFVSNELGVEITTVKDCYWSKKLIQDYFTQNGISGSPVGTVYIKEAAQIIK